MQPTLNLLNDHFWMEMDSHACLLGPPPLEDLDPVSPGRDSTDQSDHITGIASLVPSDNEDANWEFTICTPQSSVCEEFPTRIIWFCGSAPHQPAPDLDSESSNMDNAPPAADGQPDPPAPAGPGPDVAVPEAPGNFQDDGAAFTTSFLRQIAEPNVDNVRLPAVHTNAVGMGITRLMPRQIVMEHYFLPDGTKFPLNEPENKYARLIYEATIAGLPARTNTNRDSDQDANTTVLEAEIVRLSNQMQHCGAQYTQREFQMLRRIITKFNPPSGDGNPDLETIAVNYCLIRLGFTPFAGDELDAAIFACDRMVHPNRVNANGTGGWAIPVVILLHHHLIAYSEVTPPLLNLRAVQRPRLARARRENVALKYVATSPTDDRTLAAVDSRQAVRNQIAKANIP